MEVEELLHSLAGLFTVKFPSSAILEAKIQSLVDVARSSDSRQKLADADAVPLILSLSSRLLPSTWGNPNSPQEMRAFILYVKLLRNLCAGNSKNQEEFVSSDRLGDFVPVVRYLAQICRTPDQAMAIEALQMLLQLLGNAAGLGESSQAKIWERFFPLALEDVAKVSNGKVQGTLSMVIFTCCRGSESRCKELLQSRGDSFIMALMLNGGKCSSPFILLIFIFTIYFSFSLSVQNAPPHQSVLAFLKADRVISNLFTCNHLLPRG